MPHRHELLERAAADYKKAFELAAPLVGANINNLVACACTLLIASRLEAIEHQINDSANALQEGV